MVETPLVIKGTAQGILLKPQSYNWSEVLHTLAAALRNAEDFFRGGRVIIELGERTLPEKQLLAIGNLLSQYDVDLWAILSKNAQTISTARSYGIITRLPKETEPQTTEKIDPEKKAMFVQRTLNSGQKLQYAGHITLIGDVNSGAEVIAGGNIVVWGQVTGVVHAGAFGDDTAVIYALDLQPTQLSIAGHIRRAPDSEFTSPRPEQAYIEDGQIIAESWHPNTYPSETDTTS
jgi:septum site-determining protein MinC